MTGAFFCPRHVILSDFFHTQSEQLEYINCMLDWHSNCKTVHLITKTHCYVNVSILKDYNG